MSKSEDERYDERLARLSEILADIAGHAQTVSLERCPYKSKPGLCTAKFSCRNQQPSGDADGTLACAHDGTFDYRLAWESRPEILRQGSRQAAAHPRRGRRSAPRSCCRERRAGRQAMNTKVSGGRLSNAEVGRSLFDFADDFAVLVPSSCGRTGRCHECIVEVTSGAEALTERTEAEGFLKGNFRLACQAKVQVPLVRRSRSRRCAAGRRS